MQRSTIALAGGILGAMALGDILLGPALVQLGVLSPIQGFGIFAFGGAGGGLLALLVGAIGLYFTRAGAGKTGRGLAFIGVAGGAAALAIIFLAGRPGSGLPRINDITTNPADPPVFAADPSGRGRDMSYPPKNVRLVESAYADLTPIEVDDPPAVALQRAQLAAEKLGWEVTSLRTESGELEASDTTGIFEFVDDVVVRVRASDGGSVIDVRSKSRDGQGDLGANAKRIRAFRDAL